MPSPFVDSTSRLIDTYNRNNSEKIHVNVIRGPMETESVSDLAISSLLLGNSPYDIILIDVTWLAKYAEAGWLKNLDESFSETDKSELADGARLGNEYNGHLYRWPLVADIGLLYWRNDLLKKAPSNTEELVELSTKLQKSGKVKYGYVFQGKQYEGLSCVFLEILKGHGGYWLKGKTDVGLNEPESIDAANWLKSLVDSGVSPRSTTNYTESEALQAFKSGDAAFMRNWPYAWSELQKESSNVQGKVSVSTMVAAPGYRSSATLGSWGFSVLEKSTHPRESENVIRYLTSDDSLTELFIRNSYTPTTKKVLNDTILLANYPILSTLNEALKITDQRPQTALYAQISDVLQRNLSSILTGHDDVMTAMKKAKIDTEAILYSAGEL